MKVEHILADIIDWVCAGILLAMLADMVLQVVCRFILKMSVPWTDELARYLWISITYVGVGAAVSDNSHVEIALIASLIKKIKRERKKLLAARLTDIVRYVILLFLSCFLFKLTWPYLLKVMAIGQLSAALHMPSWILVGVLAFGMASMALHTLFRLILSIGAHEEIIDPVILGKEVQG